jgi:hypothetical protein
VSLCTPSRCIHRLSLRLGEPRPDLKHPIRILIERCAHLKSSGGWKGLNPSAQGFISGSMEFMDRSNPIRAPRPVRRKPGADGSDRAQRIHGLREIPLSSMLAKARHSQLPRRTALHFAQTLL